MSKAFVQPGDIITATAPYAVTSGAAALVGATFFGVAMDDISSGALGQWKTTGVWDLVKDTSTFASGDKVYWDNTAHKVTSTSTSNKWIGVAVLNNADGTTALGGSTGDATARVRLNGFGQ